MTEFRKKLFIICTAITLWCSLLFARAPDTLWTKTYGDTAIDIGYSVLQTGDRGFLLLGSTSSYTPSHCAIWLLKTNELGDTLWTKTYGAYYQDNCGYSVLRTTDGGYIILGGIGSETIWLIKTDSSGNYQWEKGYGGENFNIGSEIQRTTDGGYIIVGLTNAFGAGGFDIWLIKTDSLGDSLWTRTYGGPEDDAGLSVKHTTGDGYIITGYTNNWGNGLFDIWLLRTDSSGDTLWTKTFGGNQNDIGNSVHQTDDGGYIVGGRTGSFGAGNDDILLIKTDTSGDTMWTKTFGGINNESISALIKTFDGGFLIIGFKSGDYWFIKTDSLGNQIWSKTYGGSDIDCPLSGQQTADAGFIIIGYTYSYGAGSADIWLQRLSPDEAVNEKTMQLPQDKVTMTTIISGSLPFPTGKKYKLFDIMGRVRIPGKITPGIYFIEVDGQITHKIIKVQ